MMQHAIAIDLGGTTIKYAVISQDATIVFQGKLPSNADLSSLAVIQQINLAITYCKEFVKCNNLLINGIGIGTPGLVDTTQRVVMGGADNIQGWSNIPLADVVEERSGLDVWVDNDANLMGLGETAFGAAKGCSDVVFLTVGTGIGGALIINGKLYSGYQNRGTELGHTVLFADGESCPCGSSGCLEQYASTSALIRRFKARCIENEIVHPGNIDGEFIVNLYKKGDPVAVESIEEHCFFLGRGIAGIINIFSPQKVVIGGGISESGDFYIEKIRSTALQHAMADCSVNTEIVAAQLGNNAGCMGAARLVFMETCKSKG